LEKQEAFNHEFYWFLDELRILASTPEYQQKIMGGLGSGVAWELRTDLQFRLAELIGNYIDKFSTNEVEQLKALAISIDALPYSAYNDSGSRSNGMHHPAWSALRSDARQLIGKNRENFKKILTSANCESDWLDDFN